MPFTYYHSVKWVRKQFFNIQLKMAVRQAKSYSSLFDKKYMVVLLFGTPKAVSKQQLKRLLIQRMFKKGTTIQDIEKRAFYISK